MRTLFPIAVVLLILLALPAVAVFAADLFGFGADVNTWLEARFGVSHRVALALPAALVLFCVPPLIVLLYFLRLKRKPIPVPSTFLWKKSIEDLHVNRLMQWLRRNVLLLLQLLAILVMIYGVLGPRLHGAVFGGRHYILMLDDDEEIPGPRHRGGRGLGGGRAEAPRRSRCAASARPRQRPAGERPDVGQAGNLAMFPGDFDEAVARFAEAERLNRAEGRNVAALMCEIWVCQAMTYAGNAAEARRRLVDLRQRAGRSRNPSAIAWAYYVTGEATADVDVPAALRPTASPSSSRKRWTTGCSSGWRAARPWRWPHVGGRRRTRSRSSSGSCTSGTSSATWPRSGGCCCRSPCCSPGSASTARRRC